MHIGKRIWKPSNEENPKAKIQVYNEYRRKWEEKEKKERMNDLFPSCWSSRQSFHLQDGRAMC
jgi:hypothetical protein